MTEKKVLVETEISIGGDLPESKLGVFIHKLSNLYDVNDIFNRENVIKSLEGTISFQRSYSISAPFILKILTPEGSVDTDFIIFCHAMNLHVCAHFAPYVSSNGEYINEMKWYSSRSLTSTNPWIPLYKGMPTVILESTLKEIQYIFDCYDTPIEDAPLLINDENIVGEVTRRKLAGEPLRKILIDVLKSGINYEQMTIPVFTIVKGK